MAPLWHTHGTNTNIYGTKRRRPWHHRGGPAEPGRHVQGRREHGVDHHQVRVVGRDEAGQFLPAPGELV
jgi:hypothetical protein